MCRGPSPFLKRCCLTRKFIIFLATGSGAGLAPVMPGTVGTLLGIPMYLVFSVMSWPLWLLSLLALTALGWYTAQEAETIYGQKDSPRIVIDEIVGLQWTLLFMPPTLSGVLLGFIFFRFFDIVKVFPVNWLQQKLPGGYGIMSDDIAAALYARLALEGVNYFAG